MEAQVIIKDITKTYILSKKQQKIERVKDKRKVAVNGLSFTAYKGEIYGLLGPNGAGKTTALRCISTLIKPDSGDIIVNGHSVITDPEGVRQSIGFLTSDLQLEAFFTPNYLFDYFARLRGVTEDIIKERKKQLFEKFGIDRFAEVKVGELSTGMRQKVQIAISLLHDPAVIVFDEPTNGLDVLTAKVVTDYLTELKNEGKTIIISTHIFSVVEKICDRVGIIINGKLLLTETIDEAGGTEANLENQFFELVASESEEA
ncbi:MAG: ABC transporter ATP-binding protein [Candidatus Izemoplasmatales bacterium]|nr:ABC transporter ATP-binding protein [Candidatus Izemoplasmatales bacterium]MDD3864838.1 ABC transporter ATP-binding protein [Candidatus Izemoplasmatales bacterium]